MARHTAPGRLIDIGGRRLHLYESGQGSPAVVLESGLAATSLSWRVVQDEVAKFTRVISYDRAGLGWSGSSPVAPTLAAQVDDLHALLSAAGQQAPYILAAHSFGALIARAYAARYPGEVTGMALVDPLRTADWYPLSDDKRRTLARGAGLARRGAMLARAGVVGWCLRSVLAGSRWLPKTIGAAAGGRGSAVMKRLAGEVAKMPRELWPMVAEHWSRPESFLAMAAQLEALPAAAEEMSTAPALNRIPTTLLRPDPGGGHWIQLDHPRRVIDAIRGLVHGTM